jgi:hypothetical protein
MNNISKVSLEDTLYLIQLMRQTALSQGLQAQATRLTPVESEMRGLVTSAHQAQPAAAPASGMLGQSDFKKLLEVTQSQTSSAATPAAPTANAALERNRMIQAMASASMSEIDIARQFGVTREEVRLVLSTQSKGGSK